MTGALRPAGQLRQSLGGRASLHPVVAEHSVSPTFLEVQPMTSMCSLEVALVVPVFLPQDAVSTRGVLFTEDAGKSSLDRSSPGATQGLGSERAPRNALMTAEPHSLGLSMRPGERCMKDAMVRAVDPVKSTAPECHRSWERKLLATPEGSEPRG